MGGKEGNGVPKVAVGSSAKPDTVSQLASFMSRKTSAECHSAVFAYQWTKLKLIP